MGGRGREEAETREYRALNRHGRAGLRPEKYRAPKNIGGGVVTAIFAILKNYMLAHNMQKQILSTT